MKQFYSLCMIMLLASVLAIDVMGQKTTLTVTGKVTDLEGDPLSGVSVVVQGTTRGTITNIDGAYSINVPSKQSVLVFSMISMKTVDHRVGNSTQINIIMEEDVIGLGDVEVVAIGYGSMRRSDLTGSISSISKDALSERAITSLEDAMRGKAAGMQIVQNDGAPGSDYTIRIRGASSVNASSAPIFVIDGVICEDASSLNPGDVASIEILKDASSTAIYGSRGANGVIMITTRQGTNDGKTRVELYANLGMQQAVRQFDMLNSSEYALMRYKTGWKYYPYGTDPSTISDGIVYRDNPNGDGNYWVLPESSTYADWESYGAPGSTNTQWQDLMFRDALYQEYRINVSGGNKNTRYSVSGGYLNQEGVVVNSGFERFTGRINLVQKLSTNVTMTANISGSRTKNSGLATGSSDGLMVKLLRQSPLNSATSSGITEGTGSEEGQVVSNPYIQVRDITNNRYKDNLTARMQLEWKILTELSLNIAGTYEDNHQKTDVFYPANTEQGFKANGRAIVTNAGIKKLSGEAFLTYTNSWKGGHRLKVLAGSTLETYNNNTVRTETQNFPSLNLGVNGLGMGVTPQIPTSSIASSFYPMYGSDLSYGASIDRPANPSLRWETTDMVNLGLDMSFFKNRLAMTVDVYRKKTTDLLIEKNAALATGYEKGWANIGAVRNQGIEITLDATPILTKKWNWTLNANIGFNRSKVLDIGPGDEMGFDPGVIPGSGNFVMIRKNKSLGQWYGYKIDGVYASQHEINEQGLTEVLGQKIASIRPGDYRFRDQNGDGKITSADLVLLGSGEPDFTGGLTNTVSYKNLSLSVAMQFSYGATVFNANLHSLTSGRDGHNQIAEMNTKSWSPTLYDADGNVFFAGNNEAKYRMPGGVALNYCTSKMLEDGSFLRIGDITLAYALGKKVAKKVGMQNIKLFASVKNLCVFTKYTGFDPEVNTRQGQTGDLMPSLDYSAYPRNRSYSVGFNFIF